MGSSIDQQVTTDTLIELDELVLKNNILEFSKTYKPIRGTIGVFGGGILTIYFLFGNIFKIAKKIVERIYQQINSFHPTIKFTAAWSKEKVDFSDVEVTLKSGVLSTCLFVKPTETHQFLDTTSRHSYHCKKACLIARN